MFTIEFTLHSIRNLSCVIYKSFNFTGKLCFFFLNTFIQNSVSASYGQTILISDIVRATTEAGKIKPNQYCDDYFLWIFYRQVNEMTAQTVLMDFSIDPSRIGDKVGLKDTVKLLEKGLLEFFTQLKLIFETSTSDGHLCVFSQSDAIFLNARFFNHGIIAINIEYFKNDVEQPFVTFDVSTCIYRSFSRHHISSSFLFPFARAKRHTHVFQTVNLSKTVSVYSIFHCERV